MSNNDMLNTLKSAGSAHTVSDSAAIGVEESKKTNFIVSLAIVSALLVIFGAIVCFSATFNNSDYNYSKQALGIVVGFVVMLACWKFDYRFLENLVLPLTIINIVLILLPFLPGIGVTVNGARSWIKLGIQIQPAEFAKITVILLAASVVSKYGGKLNDPIEYMKTLGILLVPFICIMLQPDLGTGLVYLFISAVALVAGGARLKYLLITLGICVFLFALLLFADELLKTTNENGEVQYRFLKNYQRQRLFVFLDPENDTSDSGYNLKQAQIAVGSGGLFGKGLFNGTQAALKYLPEAPTDFIFCVLAEELGFVGFTILIGLYAALIIISLRIARAANDLFGKLIIICVVGMWVFQIFENIGMDIGVMPITGIPLPFVSFGSSFMIVNFIMLGLIGSVALNGVATKRKRISFGSSRRHK